jgi:hypothetical protein
MWVWRYPRKYEDVDQNVLIDERGEHHRLCVDEMAQMAEHSR